MKTKLEQIETIQELLTYITAFGIPTDTESICKMQDIVGNSPVKTLVELAQDDGTKVADDGSRWSTGRHGSQKEMMALLFTIWHWEDATSFYNRHVNKEYREIKAKAQDAESAEKRAGECKRAFDEYRYKWEEAEQKAYVAECNLKKAQDEILKLKAMLFDYMTKTA